jgi:sphinganine-1-phosphate aldolase
MTGEVMKYFSFSNLLHPDIFCAGRFIEAQVIKLGIDMFNGNDNCCGITTSGGSESILYACLAYRNRGYKKGIEHPEM